MPNDSLVPSGAYELGRLRRRRDQRVQEYLLQRSKRTSHPPAPVTMCRVTRLVIYLIVFFTVLAIFTALMALMVMHFRIPSDRPGTQKIPGLATAPGTYLGDQKQIVWGGDSAERHVAFFRRQMAEFVRDHGIEGELRMLQCNADANWGYTNGQPCILMKLTQALNFEAFTYNDGMTLPEEAPNELYDYVARQSEHNRWNRIWLACHVEEPNTEGVEINYVPYRYYDATGLFTRHNTFLNISSEDEGGVHHENPAVRRVIGVQLSNIPANQNIFIECQVWAKNIPLDVGSARMMMHFFSPVHYLDDSQESSC
ncbi:hypothetical protein KR009_010662 [Drosophila setifemur]|nr:hypothetical protein KR009_010662 [Drosophila setifemur]